MPKLTDFGSARTFHQMRESNNYGESYFYLQPELIEIYIQDE